MTSGELALLISGFSLAVAIAAFVWNIWSKFIHVKPKIHVSFDVYSIVFRRDQKKLLGIYVTNMGPGPAVLHSCIVRGRDGLKKRFGLINPIEGDVTRDNPTSQGPFSGGLPCKIEAGEVKAFYFPFAVDCFVREQPFDQCGVNDTYHRNHWCTRKEYEKVRAKYREAFYPAARASASPSSWWRNWKWQALMVVTTLLLASRAETVAGEQIAAVMLAISLLPRCL